MLDLRHSLKGRPVQFKETGQQPFYVDPFFNALASDLENV